MDSKLKETSLTCKLVQMRSQICTLSVGTTRLVNVFQLIAPSVDSVRVSKTRLTGVLLVQVRQILGVGLSLTLTLLPNTVLSIAMMIAKNYALMGHGTVNVKVFLGT
eukprot:TRINITY_DN34127_c0_g1_i1.p2 TRINITY_DN34127_c0_g1~~TRINITY_DN34127_c0_g1_i1.p2  ORF type:complete len:107 (-),score=8.82 TRINITY_DN34127_c0_g1_i1:91-411(-)